jgi:hypothetical protein
MGDVNRFGTSRAVNRSLLKMFMIFWLCAAFHLSVIMYREIVQESPSFRFMGLAPPAIPVVMVMYGKRGMAVLTFLLTALVASMWVVAVRRPSVSYLRLLARATIVLYWLFLWFNMAMSM